jgi:hypothetical protein
MSQVHPLTFLSALRGIDERPVLETMPDWRQRILTEALFTFRQDGFPQYNRILTGRAKKQYKTTDAVLAGLYKLLVWKAAGGKGNQVFFVASDLGQADDDLDLAKKLIRLNPILEDEVVIKTRVIERRDGRGFIEILPANDAQGLHGKTYLLLIIDEFHTQKTYDLLQALELDRTRSDAVQYFASYASMYRHQGVPLVDMQKQFADGTDPRLYVSWYAGSIEDASPGLDPATRASIEDAKRSLPSWIFRRLYLNLPGQPDGAAFDAEQVEGAIIPGRKVLRPQPGVALQAFCDLSGGRNDDATLAIAHNRDGVGVLNLLIDQGAKARVNGVFSPESAVKRFAMVLKQFGLSTVTGDQYAAEWPIGSFQQHNITYKKSALNRSQIYSSFEPLLNSGKVELLDSPKLLQQLIGLVRKGERIDHASGDHDDLANSCCGALTLVTQQAQAQAYMVNILTGKVLTDRELWQRGLLT